MTSHHITSHHLHHIGYMHGYNLSWFAYLYWALIGLREWPDWEEAWKTDCLCVGWVVSVALVVTSVNQVKISCIHSTWENESSWASATSRIVSVRDIIVHTYTERERRAESSSGYQLLPAKYDWNEDRGLKEHNGTLWAKAIIDQKEG